MQPLLPLGNAKVAYSYTKHLWANGEKEIAFQQLSEFVQRTLKFVQDNKKELKEKEEKEKCETLRLMARCFHRLGEWQENLEGLKEEVIQSVLR